MSATESIMWTVDKDPALRSDFTNVTVLDGPPDADHLRRKVLGAIAEIPRLRQRAVTPPLRLAPPEWRDDPHLDLDYHLRKVALPAPATMRTLLDLAAVLSATPLDRSRPLWELTLVEGLSGGRAALLQQVHHTLADGVTGLRLSLSLVDTTPRIPTAGDPVPLWPGERPPVRTRPLGVVARALGDAATTAARTAAGGAGQAASVARHPATLGRRARDLAALAASTRRQVLVVDRGRSELLALRTRRRRYEVLRTPLEPARAAARALGGTLNDAYVTALAGALGTYLDAMGAPCDELRMAMPVHLATGDPAAFNRFAPARVLVPTGPADVATRFARVHEVLRRARTEPVLGAVGPLSTLLAPLPTALLVALTRAQASTTDFAASNLRGSPVPLYAGGRRIVASFPMGPRSGVPLNVTLLSYGDSLDLGLNLDPAAITDPSALLDALHASFEELAAAAR